MAKKVVRKRTKTSKGSRYSCGVCGLAVTIDNDCGCIDTCDIICCGREMKRKK